MRSRSSFVYLSIILLTLAVVDCVPTPADARDFFTSFNAAPPAAARVTFLSPFDQSSGGDDQPQTRIIVRPSIRKNIGQGARGYCVRTCDGRYFPVAAGREESSKDYCKSICPAAETKLYSGSSIETAYASDGKPYSKIANAFRYRNESVPGCFCQSDGRAGLAHIRIEDDKTIKVGDIVANANGLMVASGTGRKGIIFARINAARLKAERLPAVALR